MSNEQQLTDEELKLAAMETRPLYRPYLIPNPHAAVANSAAQLIHNLVR